MRRRFAGRAALGALVIGMLAPRAARSQAWNDERTRDLVQRAIARRAEQLADTALRDYQATAHGYVTFLAQLGEGFVTPPKIVKADELALEVYWRAPNQSKQVIQGRRDTLLLPTDIQYHRDHLGIVQNNFPDIIRLGDGDEVRDVPHPLSFAGRFTYDFAIGDSLRITLPGRAIDVYEVKVRPKDDHEARVIGAVYIDAEGAQVVRMAFSFTHAAFLDKQLEDLSIVLENGLVSGRFWLPRRQEIEIRRTGTWMDYPVRGIIRGRWEIGDYRVNAQLPPQMFVGPEIVMRPAAEQKKWAWKGKILDSLPPDVRAVTDADVQRVQTEARALVRAQALQRAQRATLSARNVSELVRVNRVEGIAVGAGVRQPLGAGLAVAARGRWGFDDHEAKGSASFDWTTAAGRGLRVFASSDFRNAGDVEEVSRVRNSLGAQEFGSDYTDPFRVRTLGAAIELGELAGARHRLTGAYEWERALAVHAAPATGRYEPTLAAAPVHGVRATYEAERPTTLWLFGTELQGALRVSYFGSAGNAGTLVCADPLVCPPLPADTATTHVFRASLDASIERPIGSARIVSRTIVAGVHASDWLPPQELVFFGGPTSAPGYDFHSLVGSAGASQRLELRFPVPFVGIPLGRFGRSPAQATLAPYGAVALVRAPTLASGELLRGVPGELRTSGGYPSVGVGILTLFDVLRFDVARGLRNGRWSFSVDLSRDFWSVL